MSFFLYLFGFLMLNRLMMYSPMLGMFLYVALIVFVINNNRKRWRMYSQKQQTYSQQNNYQSTQQDTSSQQTYADEKVVKDAIDVEYSEEEIL